MKAWDHAVNCNYTKIITLLPMQGETCWLKHWLHKPTTIIFN